MAASMSVRAEGNAACAASACPSVSNSAPDGVALDRLLVASSATGASFVTGVRSVGRGLSVAVREGCCATLAGDGPVAASRESIRTINGAVDEGEIESAVSMRPTKTIATT